jgi:hypothetical protein
VTDPIRVFEFRPQRGGKPKKGPRKWICSACAGPAYAEGKFHAPVFVPVDDLMGAACVVCGKVIGELNEAMEKETKR